jgi:hypothetical protein
MARRLFLILTAALACAGVSPAAETTCPPLHTLAPSVSYVYAPCITYTLLTPGKTDCLNCPGGAIAGSDRIGSESMDQPVCRQRVVTYQTLTVERHLVDGTCVPVEGVVLSLRRDTLPVPVLTAPRVVAPPRISPPFAGLPGRVQAPGRAEAPRMAPTRSAPEHAPAQRPAPEHPGAGGQ